MRTFRDRAETPEPLFSEWGEEFYPPLGLEESYMSAVGGNLYLAETEADGYVFITGPGPVDRLWFTENYLHIFEVTNNSGGPTFSIPKGLVRYDWRCEQAIEIMTEGEVTRADLADEDFWA